MSYDDEAHFRSLAAELCEVPWVTHYDFEDELRAAAASVFGVKEMQVQISNKRDRGPLVAFPVKRGLLTATRVVFL